MKKGYDLDLISISEMKLIVIALVCMAFVVQMETRWLWLENDMLRPSANKRDCLPAKSSCWVDDDCCSENCDSMYNKCD